MESLRLERGGPQLLVMKAAASRKPLENAGEPAGLEQGRSVLVCRFQQEVPGVSTRSYFSRVLAPFATAHLYCLPPPSFLPSFLTVPTTKKTPATAASSKWPGGRGRALRPSKWPFHSGRARRPRATADTLHTGGGGGGGGRAARPELRPFGP